MCELGVRWLEGRFFFILYVRHPYQYTDWYVIFSWLALFATFGSASSFGVYQDLYVLSGTASSLNVAWIGSVQLFLLTLMGLPAGKLLDKGYFRHVVLAGSIIYVFR